MKLNEGNSVKSNSKNYILAICGIFLILLIVTLTFLFACRDVNKGKNEQNTPTAPSITTSATSTPTSATATTTPTTTPTTTITTVTTAPTATTATSTTTAPTTSTTVKTPPPTTPQPPKPTQTQPPKTEPPVTQPPQTQPPVTEPPQKTVFDDVAMAEIYAYGQSLGFGYTFRTYFGDTLYFAMDDNSKVLVLERYDAPEGKLEVGYAENKDVNEITFKSFDRVDSISNAKAVILEFYNEQNT